VIKEAKTWTAAAACAVQRGGFLVQINDQAEQTAVYNGILSASIASNYGPVADGGGASYIWTGGTDNAVEGTWRWDGDNNSSGTIFWTGQGAAGAGGGTVAVGQFVNWGGKSTSTIQEPDDFNSNQDAAAIALGAWPYGIAGEWNDISSTNAIFYVVEYASGVGLKENVAVTQVNIFPNPIKEKMQISSLAEVRRCDVKSLDGKLIATYIVGKGSEGIDLTSIPKGVYLIDIITANNNTITKKIVKE